MYSEKIKQEIQYDIPLDLGLYIEGLLNPAEPEIKLKSEPELKIESIILNDLLPFEINDNVSEIKEKTAEVITTVITEASPVPLWAQESFECLLVKAAGTDLIVPAMSVSYIEQINKKIIRLPLDSDAFRGVVTLRERSVAVIDLFKLVSVKTSINNKQDMQIDAQHIEHVIVMENGCYALACDYVGDFFKLTAEDVRWNKNSFNNPMFAGIVTEYLCPIINMENIQQQVAAMPFVQSLNNNY
jgi:chemotaxis signal transduction protein